MDEVNLRRAFPWLAGTLLIIAGAWANRGPSAQTPSPVVATTPGGSTFALQGAGSCAAQACHNADALTAGRGGEYRIALERDFSVDAPRVKDKHAQAFAILFDKPAQDMLRKWKGLSASHAVHPEREVLCLRCHVHPDFDRHALIVDGIAQFRLEDGVSCEACHGPAERWLAAHFRPEWRDMPASRRAEFGMADTRSVAGRARVCVDCHVGSPQADVDHDLIAAGHPWLKFEAADHHSQWHKHWSAAKDKNPARSSRASTDFEARLWLVGQVASAKAALELLAERARDPNRPWPEFAEHDCHACHHDLTASARQPIAGGKAGAPPWNAWYTAMLPSAVKPTADPGKLDAGLKDLRELMAAWRPPRGAVAANARELAVELDQWLVQWERRPREELPLNVIARHLLSLPEATPAQTWTAASQWHKALAAVGRARLDQRVSPPWLAELPALEKLLRLPGEFDPAAVRKLATTMRTLEPK